MVATEGLLSPGLPLGATTNTSSYCLQTEKLSVQATQKPKTKQNTTGTLCERGIYRNITLKTKRILHTHHLLTAKLFAGEFLDVVHCFLTLKRPEGSTPQVNAIISVVIGLCFTQSRRQPSVRLLYMAFTLICFIFICFFSIFFCSRRWAASCHTHTHRYNEWRQPGHFS